MPKFAKAKVLSSALLLQDSHLSNGFLSQVAENPQNYSDAVGLDLAYGFEDMAIWAQQTAASEGSAIDSYSTENPHAEKLYLFMRGCQIWTATFSCIPIPKNSQTVAEIWQLMIHERGQVVKALLYMDGELGFRHGLNGIHADQFTKSKLEMFHHWAAHGPHFRT